jgi:hypothetical protein
VAVTDVGTVHHTSQEHPMTVTRTIIAALVAVGFASSAAVASADTAVAPYATGLGGYETRALLSVGDRVPRTAAPGLEYQMIGIPDGLGFGAVAAGGGSLYMNHELAKTASSEPNVGGPLNRGAFVSRFRLDGDGNVVSGERAYDTVYAENTPVGPAAQQDNLTPAFGRFCSGGLWGPEVGFDRDIYLTGEEASGAATFDGRGGQSVAIFDGQLHTLPALGRLQHENAVVQPDSGKRTVIFTPEDGPPGPFSQLYMYVGRKDPDAQDVLSRNGLSGGQLYVLKLDGHASEADFGEGTARGRWVPIAHAAALDEAQLEAAAQAAGAFDFGRVEDATTNPANQKELFFNTTGDSPGLNMLGRVYRLAISPGDPTDPVWLTVISNADAIVAAGGDTALSPDNIATGAGALMVQEDGNPLSSRPVLGAKGRDGSIWRFDTQAGFARTRVAELDPPGRDGLVRPLDKVELLGQRGKEAPNLIPREKPNADACHISCTRSGSMTTITRRCPSRRHGYGR